MNLKQAKAELKEIGMTINTTSCHSKYSPEYRVNFIGGTEESANYETDLQCAVDTAKAMYDWKIRDTKNDIVILSMDEVVNGALFDLIGE